MDYFLLAQSSQETLDKIKIAEENQTFNAHLDPITSEGSLPVTEKYPYIPGPFRNFFYFLERTFYLKAFTKKLNKKVFRTIVNGKENLKDIDSAIIICNHINKFDGLVVNYATDFKKLKIMTAEFNNRSGFLGAMMRADGILPFKNSKEMVKKFSDAIKYYLKHKTSVLFFPEGSEWWCYKKPRPFMDGAFHYAAVNNVPVLPIFITFKDKENKKSELDIPDFIVNILPAIFPDKDKTKAENTKFLKEESYKAWCNKYKEFYGKEL